MRREPRGTRQIERSFRIVARPQVNVTVRAPVRDRRFYRREPKSTRATRSDAEQARDRCEFLREATGANAAARFMTLKDSSTIRSVGAA